MFIHTLVFFFLRSFMLTNTNVNIIVKMNGQYSILPECSWIVVDPVKEIISIVWNDIENASVVSNIIFPNSSNKRIFLSNEFDDQLFVVEFIQNDNRQFYFGKLINYIKSAQDFRLKIVLSMTNSLSLDDFRERLENMINVSTPETVAITPYNRMFDPKVFETKIFGVVRIPVIYDIFYNAPYTTVKWMDGTTTTVKAGADDEFNKEYGLSMAIAKKYYECLEAPNPRAAFKKAAYKNAHDQTEKTAKRRAYKEEKKRKNKRGKNGRISSSKKSSKG